MKKCGNMKGSQSYIDTKLGSYLADKMEAFKMVTEALLQRDSSTVRLHLLLAIITVMANSESYMDTIMTDGFKWVRDKS